MVEGPIPGAAVRAAEQRARAVVHNAADRALSSLGYWVPLRVRTAIAETALDALAGWSMTIADICGCGQPAGQCELCDGPRCWRCHPWFDPPQVPCGNCLVCAGRIVGGDGECHAASWECDHIPQATADPGRDTDLLISDALTAAGKLLDAALAERDQLRALPVTAEAIIGQARGQADILHGIAKGIADCWGPHAAQPVFALEQALRRTLDGAPT